MKNVKVKYKLFSLLGMMLLALVFVGGMTLLFMKAINKETKEISKNWLPSVIIAEELNTATSDFRIAEYGHVIAQDEKTMNEYEKKLEDIDTKIWDMFETYETELVTDEEDEAQVLKAKGMWQEYLEHHNKMILRSSQNNTEDAMVILRGVSLEQFNAVSNVFSDIVDYNKTGADAATKKADSIATKATTVMIVVIVGTIILALAFASYIIKLITMPIRDVKRAARQMIEGELDVAVKYESRDELGSLASSMRELCEMIQKIHIDIDLRLRSLSKGNFDIDSKQQELYIGEFGNLDKLINSISAQLSNIMSEIGVAAQEVNIGSGSITEASQTLAQGAIHQSNSIQQMSMDLQRIAEGANFSVQNAKDASAESKKSSGLASESRQYMENMVQSMENIKNASSKIRNIIKTIDDISFQSNILALNAAVEAARAGTAGKGFAVVANEVRDLAVKSAESATDTATLIDETLITINEGSKIVDETARVMSKVIESSQYITELVEKIVHDSEEQRKFVDNVSEDMGEVIKITDNNSATSEEVAAAAEELNGQSTLLRELVGRFSLK